MLNKFLLSLRARESADIAQPSLPASRSQESDSVTCRLIAGTPFDRLNLTKMEKPVLKLRVKLHRRDNERSFLLVLMHVSTCIGASIASVNFSFAQRRHWTLRLRFEDQDMI